MTKESPESYYQKRLFELGVTKEINSFEVPRITSRYDDEKNEWSFDHEKHDDDTPKMVKHDVFESDDQDNVVINYFRLTGSHYYWKSSDSNTPKKYQRRRLKNPLEIVNDEGKKDLMKYWQAKGSGLYPFFPPALIKKYIEAQTVEVLVVVEGEFKAFKGSISGLDIIGLPSIHGFYAHDVPGKLHEDIQELITRCKVKKIVYLTDADTLTVNWADGKDLRKRINSFYAAVKNFRNSLQLLIDTDEIALDLVYFLHLRTPLSETSKGLDDLLVNLPAKAGEIKNDLLQLDLAKRYFTGKNITDNRYNNTLFNYFGLSDIERFYGLYKKFIGNREFRWGKSRYQWDGEAVAHVRHEDADKYFRVGADWMKVIQTPNKDGEMEEDIIPFKVTEITRDYKKHPDFIEQLLRFDAFCNVPNWNGSYKRRHGECYNLCNPITHVPAAGSIQYTIDYLKHLFGGQSSIKEYYDEKTGEYRYIECAGLGDPFTVALDYLTIQYQLPMQKLPVPILVSPEQGTGKSTFLKWLRAIYGSNATVLDNQRFQMPFNSHYITKFVIGLDEGFLDVEKKAEKEKLKQIATADEAFLERKGIDLKKFPYYGKLIICSNDADKVMQMDTEDRRWFVVRVPKLKEKNPKLERIIQDEIPAWLQFLGNREIYHPKQDDLWFRTEYIITEQFMKIVEVTKSRIDKVVENYLKDMFLTYRLPVLRIDLKSMLKQLNDPSIAKYKIDEKDLVYFLEERKGLKRQPVTRVKIPYGFDDNNIMQTENKSCRPYDLRYEDWLDEVEVAEFLAPSDMQFNYQKVENDIKSKQAGNAPAVIQEDLPFDQTDEDLPF